MSNFGNSHPPPPPSGQNAFYHQNDHMQGGYQSQPYNPPGNFPPYPPAGYDKSSNSEFNPWEDPTLYDLYHFPEKYRPIQTYNNGIPRPVWNEIYDENDISVTKSESNVFDDASMSGSGPRCKTCNIPGHQAKNCPDQLCTKCQGRGHNGRDCPENKRVRVAEGQNDTIYVQGLPSTITEEDIISHFSLVGIIRMKRGKGFERDKLTPQVHIYRNKETNAVNGDCTVTYEDPEAAPAAVRRLHLSEIQGSKITVTLAEKNPNSAAQSYSNTQSQPQENWTCHLCNNSNFPSRFVCHRCKAPKEGGNSGRPSYNQGYKPHFHSGDRRPQGYGSNYRNDGYRQ